MIFYRRCYSRSSKRQGNQQMKSSYKSVWKKTCCWSKITYTKLSPSRMLQQNEAIINYSVCVCLSVSLSCCQSVRLNVQLFVRLSTCLNVHLSTCLNVQLSVRLPTCLSICVHVWMSTCLSVYMSECPLVRLSTCLNVHLSVCLHVWMSTCLLFPRNLSQRDRYNILLTWSMTLNPCNWYFAK